MKKILCVILSIVTMFSLTAISYTIPYQSAMPMIIAEAASKPEISKKEIIVFVNKTYTLSIKNTKKKITWSSSDKSIATVSSTGKVRGIKAGTATITAKIENMKYKCKVTVKKPYINYTNRNLITNQTVQLKVKGVPENKVKWTSSDRSVAIVNSKGLVKGIAEDTIQFINGKRVYYQKCTISATYNGKTYKCKIKVESPKINVSKITLPLNAKTQLKVVDTDYKVTSWKSSDKTIATVSSSGVVTALKTGTVTVSAKVNDKYINSTVQVVNEKENIIVLKGDKDTIEESLSSYLICGGKLTKTGKTTEDLLKNNYGVYSYSYNKNSQTLTLKMRTTKRSSLANDLKTGMKTMYAFMAGMFETETGKSLIKFDFNNDASKIKITINQTEFKKVAKDNSNLTMLGDDLKLGTYNTEECFNNPDFKDFAISFDVYWTIARISNGELTIVVK